MLVGMYKKILDKIPAGVFAFDRKMRILFTNEAFRKSFPADIVKKGALKKVIACGEEKSCGAGDNCPYCSFYKVMMEALRDKIEKVATATITMPRSDRTEKITVRIRVFPADTEGKLFLGLTDGAYQSERSREMLSAQKMQQRLLPVGKSVGGISYSYMYIPCLEIGGDLPDVYELDNETYGVLSDVSGNGVAAAMLSAFVKTGFDHKQKSLALAIKQLSDKFVELNQDEKSYITLAAVRINRNDKKIRYCVAGHNAPILLKNSIGINEIEMKAPPVSGWIPDFCYEERELPYEKGDILVLLTDGVTECKNSVGELFGIERAESVMMQSETAEEFISKLKSALTVFSGGNFTDDITAIAFSL